MSHSPTPRPRGAQAPTARAPVPRPDSIGLWLVGARGSISTCIAYGLCGLREGVIEPLGLVTGGGDFEDLPLAPASAFVLGGHEVAQRPLSQSAGELVRERILPAELVAACSRQAAAYESRIRPGVLDAPEVGLADLDPRAARLGALPPLEQIDALRADFAAFQREHRLERVVVVNLASTEAAEDERPEWSSLDAFQDALEHGRSQPASMLYAAAALGAGHAFVNFTPNRGSSAPALRELARSTRSVHCGNDGKTGETLLKTVLAPMFRARALRVLAWQGYNMLGNRDGQMLAEPRHRAAKLRNKDEALRSLLGGNPHTHVGIDYVPSLGDWKTAYDYVHFEGFLGARMSLQFTWHGSDSALAAPLVIDLARLAEFSARRGEVGELAHTACFFKAPLAPGAHDFHAQHAQLLEWAREARAGAAGAAKARARSSGAARNASPTTQPDERSSKPGAGS